MPKPFMYKSRFLLGMALVAVALVALFSRQTHDFLLTPVPPATAKILPSLEEIAEPHLLHANAESENVVAEHVEVIDVFFQDAKENTSPFAERALSWSSKWRMISDHAPFTSGTKHERFLRDEFERHFFKAKDLEALITQVVSSYLAHVRSIENQMLVDLRADVANSPNAYLLADLDATDLRRSYDAALNEAIDAAGSNLRADVSTEIVSLISGEVLAQVAVRLGVSAGILSAGASTSWATFGVGIVVGLIVDKIVTEIWEMYSDPEAELAKDLSNRLDAIRRMIIDGTGDTVGLEGRLLQFARERSLIRRNALLTMLRTNGGAQ